MAHSRHVKGYGAAGEFGELAHGRRTRTGSGRGCQARSRRIRPYRRVRLDLVAEAGLETSDPRIMIPLLYQLSYSAMDAA